MRGARDRVHRGLAFAIAITFTFDYGASGRSSSSTSWIPAIDARYQVGIDGISLLYVLTFVLSFLCTIYTWRVVPKPGKTKAFIARGGCSRRGWPARSSRST